MIIKIAISAALLLIFSTLFAQETGTPRTDKYVGVFYFLWHGSHDASEIFQ
jgi:hypothetical protein